MIIQVLASKTKIFMVLEFVNGGELFDKIVREFCFLYIYIYTRSIIDNILRTEPDVPIQTVELGIGHDYNLVIWRFDV